MIAIGKTRVPSGLMLFPEREEPYCLEAVHELIEDGCRVEIVLVVGGGYLQVRVNEDDDSLDSEFHAGEFEPTRKHRALVKLTSTEIQVLQQLAKTPRTKQQLGARASALGSLNGSGKKPVGGLLQRGFVVAKVRDDHYEITRAGHYALSSRIWDGLIGKQCGWSWVAWNQQGYRDCIMLGFDQVVVPTVLLCGIASSIEVYSIPG